MKKKRLIELLSLVFLGIFIGLLVLEALLNITSLIVLHIKNQNIKNFESEKNSEDFYTILILGESTSENYNGYSWPEQLEAYTNKEFPKIRIINKALGGTTSAFLLSYVPKYIKEYNPDMIITMMGINDVWSYVYFANKPPSKIKLFFENLKVTKLFRIIYLNIKGNIINKSQDKKKTNKYVSKGNSLLLEGKKVEAKAAYEHSLLAFPKDDEGYQVLGEFYLLDEDLNNSLIYLKKAVELNPKNFFAVFHLAVVLNRLEQFKEEKILLKKAIPSFKNDPNFEQKKLDLLISLLVDYYQIEGKIEKIEKLVKNRGFELIDTKSNSETTELNITKLHYQLLFNITQKENITLVIMQYPTRDINDFKNYFSEEEQKNIIFIENKKNFEEILKNSSYEKVFIDKFAFPKYNFGHCTPFGNKLIAQNVANIFNNNSKLTQ